MNKLVFITLILFAGFAFYLFYVVPTNTKKGCDVEAQEVVSQKTYGFDFSNGDLVEGQKSLEEQKKLTYDNRFDQCMRSRGL